MTCFLEKLQAALQDETEHFCVYDLADEDYKLKLSDAVFCAQDSIRNKHFWAAIEQYFEDQPADKRQELIVIDAGSGTGILGLMALNLGAKRCYFVEHNPFSLQLSQALAEQLGYADRCVFVQADATAYQPPEAFDLLLSETITADFTREDFLPIVHHLIRFGNSEAQVIPERFTVTYRGTDAEKKTLGDRQQLAFTAQVGIADQILRLPKNTAWVEMQTACHLYRKHTIAPGRCSSFCNPVLLSLSQLATTWQVHIE